MRIYVASSWRNQYFDIMVTTLETAGHQVYNFRKPPEQSGFSWREIEPGWQDWTTEQYVQALKHPIAERGFESDFNAMKWADACLLVLPCGRSAHLEAGWFAGARKQLVVYIPAPERIEPELMYLMGGHCIRWSVQGVLSAFKTKVVGPDIDEVLGMDIDELVDVCERQRKERLHEAVRKDAFVQGFLRGLFPCTAKRPDREMLGALIDADAAYAAWRKERTP